MLVVVELGDPRTSFYPLVWAGQRGHTPFTKVDTEARGNRWRKNPILSSFAYQLMEAEGGFPLYTQRSNSQSSLKPTVFKNGKYRDDLYYVVRFNSL